MNCKWSEKDIALFVERDLAEPRAREIEAHLASCAACRKVAADLAESQALFKSLKQDNVSAAALSSLRSRVLTVIDCMRSLELGATDCTDGVREAAVVEVDGHHYALIVDVVEDVVEALSDPSAVRAAMGAGWERVSKGMVETEEGPLLLVDIEKLITGPAAEARAA